MTWYVCCRACRVDAVLPLLDGVVWISRHPQALVLPHVVYQQMVEYVIADAEEALVR